MSALPKAFHEALSAHVKARLAEGEASQAAFTRYEYRFRFFADPHTPETAMHQSYDDYAARREALGHVTRMFRLDENITATPEVCAELVALAEVLYAFLIGADPQPASQPPPPAAPVEG